MKFNTVYMLISTMLATLCAVSIAGLYFVSVMYCREIHEQLAKRMQSYKQKLQEYELSKFAKFYYNYGNILQAVPIFNLCLALYADYRKNKIKYVMIRLDMKGETAIELPFEEDNTKLNSLLANLFNKKQLFLSGKSVSDKNAAFIYDTLYKALHLDKKTRLTQSEPYTDVFKLNNKVRIIISIKTLEPIPAVFGQFDEENTYNILKRWR